MVTDNKGVSASCAGNFSEKRNCQRQRPVAPSGRPGVVVGLSIWWAKMCPGGRNANAVTSQELTDMGGGATFYDALVEVVPADPSAAERPASDSASQRSDRPRAASAAGFTPAKRVQASEGAAGGNEPRAASAAGFTPAERAGGLGGAAQRPPE